MPPSKRYTHLIPNIPISARVFNLIEGLSLVQGTSRTEIVRNLIESALEAMPEEQLAAAETAWNRITRED